MEPMQVLTNSQFRKDDDHIKAELAKVENQQT